MSKICLYLLTLAFFIFQLSQSQSSVIDEVQLTLCQNPLNNETWFNAGLNLALQSLGTNEVPKIQQIGYQNFLLENVPGAIADSYICGAELVCNLRALNENCPQSPVAASILKALANWSNFWKRMGDATSEAASFISSQAGAITDLFNPEAEVPGPSQVNQARVGLIVGQFAFAMLALCPPLAAIKDGLSVVKEVQGVTQGILGTGLATASDRLLTARYDQFTNIIASIGALELTIKEMIRSFIENELNDPRVFERLSSNGGIIRQIESGEFAEPIGDLDSRLQDQLVAVLASPAINRIWNILQVVVVKFSAGSLSNGMNPCEGDNLFRAALKFCDAEGNALVLRKVSARFSNPLILDHQTLIQNSPFDVAGIDTLAEFKLSMDAILQSAVINQERNGYLGAPVTDEEFIQQLTQVDIITAGLQDMIFFNLPVCDFNALQINENQRRICNQMFLENENMCIFNTFLLCACPGQRVKSVEWPYRTAGGFPCVI